MTNIVPGINEVEQDDMQGYIEPFTLGIIVGAAIGITTATTGAVIGAHLARPTGTLQGRLTRPN